MLRKGILAVGKSPQIKKSKGFLRYRQEIDGLLIEEEGLLKGANEPFDKLQEEHLRICSPLSFLSLHMWETAKPTTKQTKATIGQEHLTGFVH